MERPPHAALASHDRPSSLDRRLSNSSSVYDDDEEWSRSLSRLFRPLDWGTSPFECSAPPLERGTTPFACGISPSECGISPVDCRTGHVATTPDNAIIHGQLTDHGDAKAGPWDANVAEKRRSVPGVGMEIDRDLRGRNLCIFALLLGISVGVTCLAAGLQIVLAGRVLLPDFFLGKYITMGVRDYPFPVKTAKHYFTGHRVFSVPRAAALSIDLTLNFGLTALFDGMNYIQATTLRWALCKEGRLVFSSNPRLWTGARNFAPNWHSTNAVSSMSLILGYASLSVLTCSIYVVGLSDDHANLVLDQPVPGQRYAIDFNGWGFVGLGTSLLVQGAICSWCLAKSKIVPTWSSNPFTTARVCAQLGLLQKHESRIRRNMSSLSLLLKGEKKPARTDTTSTASTSTFSSVSTLLPTYSPPKPSYPKHIQPAMRTRAPRCRRFTTVIWLAFGLVLLWSLLTAILGYRAQTCTTSYVIYTNYRSDLLSHWNSWCQIRAPYYSNPYFARRDWAGLLIQCLALSIPTLAIHCTELLTDLTRDEKAWRKATSTGASAGASPFMSAFGVWECWLLFLFKSLTPWMQSFAFATNLSAYSTLLPLLALSLVMFSLAIFAELLVRRRPTGLQPVTFGEISRLIALVDEWHPRIFWGDKGPVDACGTGDQALGGEKPGTEAEGIPMPGEQPLRKAGTAGSKLPPLREGTRYLGLEV